MKVNPALLIFLILTMCTSTNSQMADDIIGKIPLEIPNGLLTPEVLHLLGQVSDETLSPDGTTILYGVSYTDISLNKRNRELFAVGIDGTNRRQITHSSQNETNGRWIKNGKKIAFLSNGQLHTMDANGENRRQITHFEDKIEGFIFSPDEKKVLLIQTVKTVETSSDKYPDLDKSTGKIVDNLMYKHWDEWVERIPHPFVADYDERTGLSNCIDILDGQPYESPMRPWGGVEQLAWSPDSKAVAYTCRKKNGKAYALSTNSDIYVYHLDSGETHNLTEGMMGYDTNPQFSPDGKSIAWLSMEREGYESDKNRLFVMNLETREKQYLTNDFDYNADAFCWVGDAIAFVSNVQGTSQLFTVNTGDTKIDADSPIIPITKGEYDYSSVSYSPVGEGFLVGLRRSMSYPPEVFTVNLATGEQSDVSQENADILAQITMGKVETRWIETTSGELMLTRVVYPPHFDASQKYPAILYCQGGPQNTVSQFWSTRWNLQLMAANGYIVVAPNRHGVPGFGQAWNEQISGDYGGQNMQDYLSAIDALSKEPYVDETKLGCTGASYGGFSVFWLAGNHNKRFSAFFAHSGIFNMESQYLETEELWFVNWEFGGAFWDKSNQIAQRTYANSPHQFIEKWDTPIMISHGELDYRILASQGMMAFNAAQLRDVPSRLLVFPNENHWISQPQNGVLFQREFFRWFDKWLK